MRVVAIGTTRIGISELPPKADTATRRKMAHDIARVLTSNPTLEITHDDNGAPTIPGLNISISHSRRMLVVAIDPNLHIGIDAEEYRDALRRVKPRYLSTAEQTFITSDADLLRAWTIKEAVYKAMLTPGLSFTADIAIAADFTHATARGTRLTLHYLDSTPTLITLAIKE